MCPTKSLISSHFVGVVYHNLDDEAIYGAFGRYNLPKTVVFALFM